MLVQEASFYDSNLFFKTLQGFCIDFLWFERWEENNHSREYWGTWLWLCIILFIAVIIFGTCPPCPKKEIDEAFSEYSVPAFGESIISNILQDDVKLLKRPCSRHSASCLPKCLKLPSRLTSTALSTLMSHIQEIQRLVQLLHLSRCFMPYEFAVLEHLTSWTCWGWHHQVRFSCNLALNSQSMHLLKPNSQGLAQLIFCHNGNQC